MTRWIVTGREGETHVGTLGAIAVVRFIVDRVIDAMIEVLRNWCCDDCIDIT